LLYQPTTEQLAFEVKAGLPPPRLAESLRAALAVHSATLKPIGLMNWYWSEFWATYKTSHREEALAAQFLSGSIADLHVLLGVIVFTPQGAPEFRMHDEVLFGKASPLFPT
jgi:hypothetical protein